MSSSRPSARRILRSGDGAHAPAAALLVDLPGVSTSGAGTTNGLDELIEAARKEAWQEGYLAATSEMAAAEAAGRAAQLRRVADAVVSAATEAAESRRQAVAVAGREAVELAAELAQAFLRHELRLGRPGMDAVIRALGLVPDGHDLIVRLNPADPVASEELAELAPDVSVKLVVDSRVEPGGCVIQAGPCRIDTQLSAALERIRDVLAEVYPQSPSAPDSLALVEEVA